MITDFHTHVLPNVDDGSSSVEESISMLRTESEQGIGRVVATPHFYARHDTPAGFLSRRRQAEQILREELSRHEGLPELFVGAEVRFFRGISETDILETLTIDQKGCILLEMPECFWSDSMYREIETIYRRWGITPIIAHVDRYISPFHYRTVMDSLADLPVMVQANASFFLRAATASLAMNLLRQGRIHLLGSDCHNMSSRPPNLGSAVEKIQRKLGEEAIARLCQNQALVFDC